MLSYVLISTPVRTIAKKVIVVYSYMQCYPLASVSPYQSEPINLIC